MAPKMSKKEKAEAARIAAEQAAAEAAAKAEAEEKERLATEARLAEEEKQRKAEEAKLLADLDARIEAEDGTNSAFYGERSEALARAQKEALARDEWEVFVACEPMPDVMSECAVSGFLTEWMEKPREGADHLDLTLGDCSLCVQLLRSLQLEGAYAAARGDAKCAAWQTRAQYLLRDEMNKKIDMATADFLGRAEEFANAKHECVACVASPGCRYGLWVNLAKNPRVKSIELPDLGVNVELPKALALASIAVRVLHTSIDLCTPYAQPTPKPAEAAATEAAAADATADGDAAAAAADGDAAAAAEAAPPAKPPCGMMTLGGVFSFALLALPPGAKKVKGWTMRQVTEMTDSVVLVQYPMPNADGSLPAPGAAPPLKITTQVEPHVILPDTVDDVNPFATEEEIANRPTPKGMTVGTWDEGEGRWKTESISLVEYASETRTLSFQSTRLTNLALLQPTHLELPYKNWLFSPTSPSSAVLHLLTQRFSVQIEVSPRGCTLRSPDRPELEGIVGVPLPATTLLLRLAACGINLSPVPNDAHALERVTPKDEVTEAAFVESLAPILARYQLAPSRWNPSRGPLKCMVRIHPAAPADDADVSAAAEEGGAPKKAADPFAAVGDDWQTLEYAKRRVLLVAALDGDATCDDAPKEGALAHSTPLECLKEADPDVLDLLHASSRLYQDTARQLLTSLKLFSFTLEHTSA